MDMSGRSVIGWKLDAKQRGQLLDRFSPTYGNVVADYVTLAVDSKAQPVPGEAEAAIVGHTDDGKGVEAMVVTIDGTTDRPDGSTFHITWSLGDGRRAKESNDVIRECGWTAIDPAVPISLNPARL